jgi:replicative DNA helicase
MNEPRLPPHSQEAEEGILGCVILDPALIPDLRIEWFYLLRNRNLVQALRAMADHGEAMDLMTLRQWLVDRELMEDCGGFNYLAGLSDQAPSSVNFPYWQSILKGKAILRAIIRQATKTCTECFEPGSDPVRLLDDYEQSALAIRPSEGAEESSIKDLIGECIDELEGAIEAKQSGLIRGIPSGFYDLDKLTSGFRPGQLVVIAARPSLGKTSLAMNIGEYVALEKRLPVGVFSLEMAPSELMFRLLCSRARVDTSSAARGELTERDQPKLALASTEINKAPLHLIDAAGMTISQIMAKARRLAQEHHVKLLIADYLQLIRSGERRAENETAEITLVSNGLKAMARELNVPVIALAQLNRQTERENRKPRLSDLRSSGAIEQDADLVCLLHREEDHKETVEVTLILAKHRNGPTGQIDLVFLKPFTRFESAAKVHPSDVPTSQPHREPYKD